MKKAAWRIIRPRGMTRGIGEHALSDSGVAMLGNVEQSMYGTASRSRPIKSERCML